MFISKKSPSWERRAFGYGNTLASSRCFNKANLPPPIISCKEYHYVSYYAPKIL